jgi:AraC family transcriptional regulator
MVMPADGILGENKDSSRIMSALRLLRETVSDFDTDLKVTRDRVFAAAALLGVTTDATPTSPRAILPLSNDEGERIRVFVQRNLEQSIRIVDLASLANLSKSHFCRAFKARFGVSAHAYVTHQRLTEAARLIRETDMSLSGVALACGLYDQSHLCNLFRRHLGASPSAWRRRSETGEVGSVEHIAQAA